MVRMTGSIAESTIRAKPHFAICKNFISQSGRPFGEFVIDFFG
jgi:hypothetical protein